MQLIFNIILLQENYCSIVITLPTSEEVYLFLEGRHAEAGISSQIDMVRLETYSSPKACFSQICLNADS